MKQKKTTAGFILKTKPAVVLNVAARVNTLAGKIEHYCFQ